MQNQDGNNQSSPAAEANPQPQELQVPNLQLTETDLLALRGIESLCDRVSTWAKGKGFWDQLYVVGEASSENRKKLLVDLIKSQKLMLMVSELAEQLEGLRESAPGKVPGFTNEEEELADLCIRAFDYAGTFKLRLAACILAKMAVNEKRPHRHGKAF